VARRGTKTHAEDVRPLRITAALLALLTASACTVASSTTAPSTANASEATKMLASLQVAEHLSMAGYSRERFPHWRSHQGACDTREAVLQRDGRNVTVDADCQPKTGSWFSLYDSKTFTKASELDIDHMVPLANAWRTGAKNWTDEKRADFANDMTRPQLIAVSASTNRSKGDQDPSQWKPPNRDFWCDYAVRWITVKAYWQLTVTTAEKAALSDMLGGCRWSTSPTSSPGPAG